MSCHLFRRKFLDFLFMVCYTTDMIKYIIFCVITFGLCISAAQDSYNFEEGMLSAMVISAFMVFGILPLLLAYDTCKKRGRSFITMLFPLFFSWAGFFVVWLFLREDGKEEYPFQSIF